MLGPQKRRHFDRQLLVSLENLVPHDNFYRHLDTKLDLSFVREWVADCYANCGRPSIDPIVFFKLELILFFEGLRSERMLMKSVTLNLAQRWYAGYDLDEPLPDHSSLTRIRQRLGLTTFARFFEHVVELCEQEGLVWGKELIFDSTNVRANAAMDSLRPRWYADAKAHLRELFAGDLGPAAGLGEAEPAKLSAEPAELGGVPLVQLPFAGSAEEQRELAGTNEATWKLLEEYRLPPERPSSRGYQRTTDRFVSTTDPDAVPMRKANGEAVKLGFHDHYVVDGGKGRIILNAFVTPADVMDNVPMLDLLRRARFRWHVDPQRAVADSKYGTITNIRSLEDEGICAYVPLPDFDKRTGYYGLSQFHYDPDADCYWCPEEQPLLRYTAKNTEDGVMYRAEAAVCNACPVKAACTPSRSGRSLRRSDYTPYLERVKGYHETEAYKKAMRKRGVWVEPLFGEAKDWHGLRRFRLRGLWKVNCEALLTAAGQNLKRWLSQTGWGRRHGPTGSLALRSLPSEVARPVPLC
jgi:transposase